MSKQSLLVIGFVAVVILLTAGTFVVLRRPPVSSNDPRLAEMESERERKERELQKQLSSAQDEEQRKAIEEQLREQQAKLEQAKQGQNGTGNSDAGQRRCDPGDPLCSDLVPPSGSSGAKPKHKEGDVKADGLMPLD